MDTETRFFYTELSTADKARAGRFYGRLLGWELNPEPLLRAIEYTLFTLQGSVVAGAYPLLEFQRRRSDASRWLSYVFVADGEETAKRARELGASVLAGPLDVLDLGRLTILEDPLGTRFGTWQAGRLGVDFQLRDQPGCASWFEHVSAEPERAAAFYADLFGWTRRPLAAPAGQRVLLELHGAPVAGCSTAPGALEKLAPEWLAFFQVKDCAESCGKAANLNGKVLLGPGGTSLGPVAVIRDPDGASFGLTEAG